MEEIQKNIISLEDLTTMLKERRLHEARERLSEMQEVDLAELLSELDDEQLSIAFRILPKELAADVFSYLESDTQQELIQALSDKEVHFIVENLFLDDTVDMIEEMPANVVKRILQNADPVTRRRSMNS